MSTQVFDMHDPGVSEVGTVVLLVFVVVFAVIVVGLLHGAALGLLGRRGLVGTVVAALIGFGGVGWLAIHDGVARFDRVAVQDDGTWRFRNGLGMYVAELPQDAGRRIDIRIVPIVSRGGGIHWGCEVHVRSGGRTLRSAVGYPKGTCGGPADQLRQADIRRLAHPAAPSHRPDWPRDTILATAGLLLTVAAARWALAQLALARSRTGLARDDRWIPVRLIDAARVELGSDSLQPHTWTPDQVAVRRDDRRLQLNLGKANFPVPIGAGRRGAEKLVAAGFQRPPQSENDADEQPLALDFPAGHPLEVLGTADGDTITAYPDMAVVVTDPALAPRAAWLTHADLPARDRRNVRYLVFWVAVFVAAIGWLIADFF